MNLHFLDRLGLERILEALRRGEMEIEEVIEHVEDLLRRGVEVQPSPPTDQISGPSSVELGGGYRDRLIPAFREFDRVVTEAMKRRGAHWKF